MSVMCDSVFCSFTISNKGHVYYVTSFILCIFYRIYERGFPFFPHLNTCPPKHLCTLVLTR